LVGAAFPVPDSETDWGSPVTLSNIIRWPVCGIVSTGLKVTDTLQLLRGARVASHSDATVNTDGDALSVWMLTVRPFFFLPAFLILIVLAWLVVPNVTSSPNFSERGFIVSFSSTRIGVAVAVGVGVVPVAVAVAVAVKLGVAVGVRVLDSVAVAVAVADGVAVKVGVPVIDAVAVAVAVGVDVPLAVVVGVPVCDGVEEAVAVAV
jgi:hypothetical protein